MAAAGVTRGIASPPGTSRSPSSSSVFPALCALAGCAFASCVLQTCTLPARMLPRIRALRSSASRSPRYPRAGRSKRPHTLDTHLPLPSPSPTLPTLRPHHPRPPLQHGAGVPPGSMGVHPG
eukprot:2441969-Alexandrium_andersonii.AAC.2